MEKPESVWLAAYRNGQPEALGKLVEQYRRPLYAFIYKMMEGHIDADEIFQDVWIRVIRHAHTYRDRNFLSWLFRIAHNLVIDRARKRRPMVELDGQDEEGPTMATRVTARTLSPSDETAGHDLGRRIAEAVARLPEDQRAVFLMRTEGNMTFKDIAAIQGTSINTALARMQYALNKLRVELKSDYDTVTGAAL